MSKNNDHYWPSQKYPYFVLPFPVNHVHCIWWWRTNMRTMLYRKWLMSPSQLNARHSCSKSGRTYTRCASSLMANIYLQSLKNIWSRIAVSSIHSWHRRIHSRTIRQILAARRVVPIAPMYPHQTPARRCTTTKQTKKITWCIRIYILYLYCVYIYICREREKKY